MKETVAFIFWMEP